MKDVLEILPYPIAFLFVGILYEWWCDDPFLRRLRRERTDIAWHFLLIVLVGGFAWLLSRVIGVIIPQLPVLVSAPLQGSRWANFANIAQAVLDGIVGAVLLLPLHLLSRRRFKKDVQSVPAVSDSGDKSRPLSAPAPVQTTPVVVNLYFETEKAGKVNIGKPNDDGSVDIQFGPVAPGQYGQLYATTADPTGGRKDIPVSGSIAIPTFEHPQAPTKYCGSGVGTSGDYTPQKLDTGLTSDEMSLFAGPVADKPGMIRFQLVSPPGTIQKIVQKEITTDKNKPKGRQ